MTSAARAFRLLPLTCPQCGAGVAAEDEDVVYHCVACRSGFRLDPAGDGLLPVEVAFVTRPDLQPELFRPFWRLPARLELLQRDAAAGFGRLLGGLFDAGGGGVPTGRFLVPAFRADLAAVVALTRAWSGADPVPGERLGERLTGGCHDVEDARRLAHYAVIAGEVERPDTLRDLRYRLVLGEPGLLGIPFVRRREHLVDARFGIAI